MIHSEGLGDFFKNLGKRGLHASKKMSKNVLKKNRRALEIGANLDNAFASGNPKQVLSSLPEVINFYHTVNVYTLESLFDFIPSKWNKKQKDYTHLQH